jgi:PPOX class probable F420-dependent enzyme
MLDYGTLPPDEGSGLLPWSWAEERLTSSHDYWVATVWPDGRPHVTPVWGAWVDGAVWFSCGPRSRKARNLAAEPRCTVTTDNAYEPVMLNGTAALVEGRDAIRPFAEAAGAKYGGDVTLDFLAANSTFRVAPTVVIALTEDDFGGSPTRWSFEP